jgi:hypothetical protein
MRNMEVQNTQCLTGIKDAIGFYESIETKTMSSRESYLDEEVLANFF